MRQAHICFPSVHLRTKGVNCNIPLTAPFPTNRPWPTIEVIEYDQWNLENKKLLYSLYIHCEKVGNICIIWMHIAERVYGEWRRYVQLRSQSPFIGGTKEKDQHFLFFYLCIFVRGRWQPTQSQLIQIYSVYWRDVYDTHNIEHRTEPFSH